MTGLYRLLVDKIRVLNPTSGTDGHGNPVDVYEPDGGDELPARVVSADAEERADATISGTWRVWLQPGNVTVTAKSRIIWLEDEFEVDGEPWVVTGLGARPSHVELRMRRSR